MSLLMIQMLWLSMSTVVTFSGLAQGQASSVNTPRHCFPKTDESSYHNMPLGEDLVWRESTFTAHNDYRRLHGSSELIYNEGLCRSAYWTVDRLIEIRHQFGILTTFVTNLEMFEEVNCGINLYEGNLTSPITGKEVVDSWYAQSKDYDLEKAQPKSKAPVDAFTQLIWNASSEMCMIFDQSKEGRVSFVALYWPMGNVPGQYQDNVKPPSGYVKPKKAKCASVMLLPWDEWAILFLVFPIAMLVQK